MGHELAMGLRRAYLALHRATNAFLAESGVAADQFVVLTSLAVHGAMTQTQLAQRTFSDPNAFSAMLSRLHELGYVARKRHQSDGRFRMVSLTRRGRTMQSKMSTVTQALRQRLTSHLESADLHELIDCLNGMADLLERPRSSSRDIKK